MPGPQYVPYAMVEDAQRTLGVSMSELADMLCISLATLVASKKEGKFRKTYAIAINGLLAEHRLGGHGQVKDGLPALVGAPTLPQKKGRREVSDEGRLVMVSALIPLTMASATFAYLAGAGATSIHSEEK